MSNGRGVGVFVDESGLMNWSWKARKVDEGLLARQGPVLFLAPSRHGVRIMALRCNGLRKQGHKITGSSSHSSTLDQSAAVSLAQARSLLPHLRVCGREKSFLLEF